jgi:NitT/TauT family transport system permease protein
MSVGTSVPTAGTTPALDESGAASRPRRPRRSVRQKLGVGSVQLLILAAILAAWQWVPQIHGAPKVSPVFDSFFVSSPTKVGSMLYRLATGAHHTPMIWGPFQRSVVPAIIGTALAIVVGAACGLIASNWETVNRVARPFVLIGNSIPRITLIPIVIVIFGPTSTADIVIGFLVVFFLTFWNAYEGGISVPQETLENLRILGASRFEELRRVRFPYVLVWTFASLPVAIGFGLTAIVTAELFTGSNGLGRLLLIAVQTANADLTVAVTFVLGFAGLVLIALATALRQRVLHWWY